MSYYIIQYIYIHTHIILYIHYTISFSRSELAAAEEMRQIVDAEEAIEK